MLFPKKKLYICVKNKELRFALFIARRYLFSRKSTNVINVISGISVVGVATVTAALIVVLSVMNGFNGLLTNLFSTFDPDLKITLAEGKSFRVDSVPINSLKAIEGVEFVGEVIEDNAVLSYKKKQYVATLKGMSVDYASHTGIDSMMVDGVFLLEKNEIPYAVLGIGVRHHLGISIDERYQIFMDVFVPKRTAKASHDLTTMYSEKKIQPAGVFSIQQDYDTRYVLVPISFMRSLLDYEGRATSLEIKLSKTANQQRVKNEVQKILGSGFVVKDRYQQHEFIYKIMQSEKLVIFLILSFILMIASFNILGSLTMLIIDKKQDILILRSLGASNSLIKKIFLLEGWMISLLGAILGLIIGAAICWVQITFELVELQSGGSFIINAYPVIMEWTDFIIVFAVVTGIGFLAAWYPVSYLNRKYMNNEEIR
jgi:lipoprotein-releasing system permease protein